MVNERTKENSFECSDKEGIVEFQRLVELGFEIISTGGTYKRLKDAGISVLRLIR